jgi:hypothetical protein
MQWTSTISELQPSCSYYSICGINTQYKGQGIHDKRKPDENKQQKGNEQIPYMWRK